jgi:polyisoprenoid-binding protein YceI
MTLFGKAIITIIILGLIGVGAYAYATRPLAAPSTTMADEQPMPADIGGGIGDSSGQNGVNSTSTATSSSAGMVASYKIAAGTKAEFNINEVLRGSPFTVVGTTSDVTGTVQVDTSNPENSVVGTIKINARTLKTDSTSRDSTIGRFILKSEDPANEFITFETKEISGLPSDAAAKVANGEEISFKVKGDLTIAGITKSTTFDAKFSLAKDGRVTGSAQAKIKRSDFKLVIPNIPFVANVPDEFLIKLNAVLTK